MSDVAQDKHASMPRNLPELQTYQYYMILRGTFPFDQVQTISHGAKTTNVEAADGATDREMNRETDRATIKDLNKAADKEADAIDEPEAIESQPSGIGALSTKIILNIISFIDDIPSVVVFALTTRRHYAAIVAHFKVKRLRQICPKDVRSPFPPELDQFAYNTLQLPKSEEFNPRKELPGTCVAPYRIENYFCPDVVSTESVWAELDSLRPKDKICVLSFVRRLKWIVDEEDEVRYDCYLAWGMMAGFVEIPGLPVVRVQVRKSDVKGLLKVRRVVPSVEYLVLRDLLRERCRTVTEYELTSAYNWALICACSYTAFVLVSALVWFWAATSGRDSG
ncbi:hypothetical protein H2200_000225 [Cladophialophora chaetospira]|uniref:Uncharacterized protein n=1 Tax=Cladophialophora chaetospira TaxID=386627 RepID=A0AA38XNV9_9EURO|nr:hypothetical protein H2200_000225 [Cladophialophora chaetospira]